MKTIEFKNSKRENIDFKNIVYQIDIKDDTTNGSIVYVDINNNMFYGGQSYLDAEDFLRNIDNSEKIIFVDGEGNEYFALCTDVTYSDWTAEDYKETFDRYNW